MLVLWLALISPPALAEDCTHTKSTFKCVKYLKNYDGDTVTVSIPGVHPLLGEKISVRIAGVDTPEIKGKLPCEKDAARTARRMVESLMKNAKVIELDKVSRDKYFRINAVVLADGKNVGMTLIKNNLAYPYGGGTKQKVDWCGRTRR